MADHVLVGTELRYSLRDRTILDGVSVRAEGGRMLAVRGPSGSGKSTLLALLGGLATPTSGTVTIDGTTVSGGDLTLRRRVGLVLQGYGLVAALTARENISIVLQAQRVPRDQIRSRVQAVLDEVGLGTIADRQIEDLSGGQQQRVAVARALVTDPEVLLTDEPTAELDGDNRARIVGLLVARARSGAVVVVASHDPDVVAACDDVLDLRAVTEGVAPSHDTAPSGLNDSRSGRHRA